MILYSLLCSFTFLYFTKLLPTIQNKRPYPRHGRHLSKKASPYCELVHVLPQMLDNDRLLAVYIACGRLMIQQSGNECYGTTLCVTLTDQWVRTPHLFNYYKVYANSDCQRLFTCQYFWSFENDQMIKCPV